MVTGGHGVRWQYDYTHDSPGPMTDSPPRWLRLNRTGDTLTGYESSNGSSWTQIGTTHLAGLPATVSVGLFVTSPVSFQGSTSGSPSLATAAFDHVGVQPGGTGAANAWHGQSIGNGPASFYPTLGSGGYHRAGSAFVLSGSGDIAPGVGESLLGANTAASILALGLVVGLLAIVVVATMFITTEYRSGLIRTTFTATPDRRRVLAAKAVVIGAVGFVIGAVAAAAAVPLGEHILTANGNYVLPTSTLTGLRIIAGSGALVALSAVAVVALGTILRRSAGAVTAGIIVFVLPYVLGSFLSDSAVQWLYRLTPVAGFSVLQTLPTATQVSYPYTFGNGYYPLAPWAGLAVLCAYAGLAFGLAAFLLRRRDA